jgi:hypothetical protein
MLIEKNSCEQAYNGVLYIITTHKDFRYLKAGIESAKSIKYYSPQLSIHIYTDYDGLNFIEKHIKTRLFDSKGLINTPPHYRSKVDYISKSPFVNTLYLDSDTLICDDISEMYELLNEFDIALAHAHKRNTPQNLRTWRITIPYSFPQYNSGVILYRNTKVIKKFFETWADCFHEAKFIKDQVTLRELLFKSKLRIATLPPEYNIRYQKYIKIWSTGEAKPKILHMSKFHGKNKFTKYLKGIKKRLSKIKKITANLGIIKRK